MAIFKAEQLTEMSVRLLERVRVSDEIAQVVSRCTVENCLWGHDSHGMALIPRFIGDIETGKIKPDARTRIVKKSDSIALIDGQRGFGQITLFEAMKTAMDMARAQGISSVTVNNCNHVGILWNFVKMAADDGMIGMIWCVSGPTGGGGVVAPYGGRKRAIGANPVAVAIPAGDMRPFVLDISTCAVAGGKVFLHAQQGKPIPLGWILDEEGCPTEDPNKLFKTGDIRQLAGALLPMAGYKGFGLGLAAELLGGILTGYGAANDPDYQEGNGCFIMALDVKRFVPLEEFGKKADALFRYVKSIPTDKNTEEIFIPGEIEFRTWEQRTRDGIPVADAVWKNIVAIAHRLGVDVT